MIEAHAPALKAFGRVAEAWKLTPDEVEHLVGCLETPLDDERLRRVVDLVAIFSDLSKVVCSDERGAVWIRSPNLNPIFGGRAPLQMMLEGGPEAVEATRRHLEATVTR